MGTGRLEAFSDGVIAIIVTIMVLELKLPPDGNWETLLKMSPTFLSYLLSFIVVAIMWVNHHAMLHRAKYVDGRLMWTNNCLLFWMSLIPFSTAYLGQHWEQPVPAAVYGAVLTLCGFSFTWLQDAIARHQVRDGTEGDLDARLKRKSNLSSLLYASSVPLAFLSVYISFGIFVLVPAMYFMPESLKEETQARAHNG